MAEIVTAAGTTEVEVVPEDDALSLTLYIDQFTSGTLDIVVYEIGNSPNNYRTLYTFEQKIAPSTESETVIITTGGRVKVVATYTGSMEFEIHGKATSTTSLKVIGAENADTFQYDVDTTAVELITTGISTQRAFIVKNHSQSQQTIYVGFSLAKVSALKAWPLVSGESLGVDLGGTQSIYAISDAAGGDVRLVSAGE